MPQAEGLHQPGVERLPPIPNAPNPSAPTATGTPSALQRSGNLAKLTRQSAKPIRPVTSERIGQSILGAAHQSRERLRPPVPRQLFYVVL